MMACTLAEMSSIMTTPALLVVRRRPLRAGPPQSLDLLTRSEICRSTAALAPHAVHSGPRTAQPNTVSS